MCPGCVAPLMLMCVCVCVQMAGSSRGSSPVSHQPQPESSLAPPRRQLRQTSSSSLVVSNSSPARSPTVLSKKGMTTPHGRKGLTPSSLRKILAKGKSPWRKLDNSEEVSCFFYVLMCDTAKSSAPLRIISLEKD